MVMSHEPRQASLRRLRQFDVRPNRELGQNFLIDDNILRLIGEAAELETDDVILEVGGGLGVLSEYLAPRVGHLHVVEVDRSLEPPLRDALADHPNTTLHLGDAVDLDLAALDPPPNKVVANLPYGVAATVLLRTIAELPDVTLWVAMVQREVADRLAAEPGSKTYGATSVLAQLACDVRLLRKIPRTVFHPEPNVDSALILMRRRATAEPPASRSSPGSAASGSAASGSAASGSAASGSAASGSAASGSAASGSASSGSASSGSASSGSAEPGSAAPHAASGSAASGSAAPGSAAPHAAVTALVHAGFAHRRKALAGSLALTPGAPADIRPRTREALERLGHPADARAERLAPEDWPRLAELLGAETVAALRPR
jgi:16S rRNA (adenine1518-N6/adenine1519-N6)-dimethyltransferase